MPTVRTDIQAVNTENDFYTIT